MKINERIGDGWHTVTLVPAHLTDNVWSTLLHGQTGQEISDGWLDAGSPIYVHPNDVGHTTHPYTTTEELPDARDVIYDASGMRYRIRHSAWSAIQVD